MTIWGDDPPGWVRYTQDEALAKGLCVNCTCWRGAKSKIGYDYCHIMTAPSGMCGKFKVKE